jgi:uncharacterized repeat protein (TIGR03847 family)
VRDLGRVSRLTTGAIGVPGRRRFYIETDTAAGAYWFLLEKQQVAALAERAMVILSERAIRPPSTTEPGDEVQEPTHVEFRVGDIELAYSRESDLVDITLHPAEDDAESVRFEANLRQLGKMATAGFAAVAAGRPLCPRCSLPMDAGGHVCPASNGDLRRRTE